MTRQNDPVTEDNQPADHQPAEPAADLATCSAKACRAPATHAVLWNNPRLHTPDREKVWHACEAHRQSLADYLDVRGFLLRVQPC